MRVRAWGVARGGHGGTFLDELAPALGPVGELLRIRLLDLGALLHAVHQVVAQAVPVIDALHRPLVVPHLAAKQRARLPRGPGLPASPLSSPAGPPPLPASPPRRDALGTPDPPTSEASAPRIASHRLHTPSSHCKHNFLAAMKCGRIFIIWTWARMNYSFCSCELNLLYLCRVTEALS